MSDPARSVSKVVVCSCESATVPYTFWFNDHHTSLQGARMLPIDIGVTQSILTAIVSFLMIIVQKFLVSINSRLAWTMTLVGTGNVLNENGAALSKVRGLGISPTTQR